MILSARSFLTLALIAVLGILGQWSQAVPDGVWRIPAAAWVLAVALEALLAHRGRLDLRRELPARAYLGQPLRSVLSLGSTGVQSQPVEIADAHAPGLRPLSVHHHGRVDPGRRFEAAVTLVPERLGSLEWERVDLRLLGRFRLAWWHRRASAPATVHVVPDHLHRGVHRSGSAGPGTKRHPVPGDGSELYGLRTYRRGDPLRDIDWKASARRQETMVRLRERDEAITLMLVVDAGRRSTMHCDHLDRLGHYINVVARLTEEALEHGDQVGLIAYAEEPTATLPPVHGQAGLRRIRQTLATVRAETRESNPVPAALAVRRLARQRALVVWLTDLDDGAAGAHLLHATRLLVPRHLPLVGAVLDGDLEVLRWPRQGNWLAPYAALASLELSRETARTSAHLQRAGARVVRAPAAALDARVREEYAVLRRRRRV